MRKQRALIVFSLIGVIACITNFFFEGFSIGNSNILEIIAIISISCIISTIIMSRLSNEMLKKELNFKKDYVVESSLKILFQRDEYLYTLIEKQDENN